MKVKVTRNTSGDWFVIGVDGEPVTEGHSFTAADIKLLCDHLGVEFAAAEVTDAEMESGDFYA